MRRFNFSVRVPAFSILQITFLAFFIFGNVKFAQSQIPSYQKTFSQTAVVESNSKSTGIFSGNHFQETSEAEELTSYPRYQLSSTLNSSQKDTVPEPLSVMYKSMMIPGWGQAVNKQYWKIPIIYAALGGVIGYTIYLDGKYDDYRAAYYNSFADPEQGTYTDQKFGPTPGYLQNVVTSQLRFNRNYYRNTRDLMVIMTGLAYGLNILDAYIFAHLRDFDVSDDLSLSAQPSINGNFSAITLTFNF